MENKEIHKLICEYTWGGIPVDTNWAINSPLYEETRLKLTEKGIITNVIS